MEEENRNEMARIKRENEELKVQMRQMQETMAALQRMHTGQSTPKARDNTPFGELDMGEKEEIPISPVAHTPKDKGKSKEIPNLIDTEDFDASGEREDKFGLVLYEEIKDRLKAIEGIDPIIPMEVDELNLV